MSFGVSAIGRVGNFYVQNHKLLTEYEAAIDRGTLPGQRGVRLDQDDSIRADVIQQIMCHGSIEIEALQAHIRLTRAGQLMMRAVAMAFDAYLRPVTASPLVSRLL